MILDALERKDVQRVMDGIAGDIETAGKDLRKILENSEPKI
jgi:DNA-binding GntR family transcriptional regulator